MVKRTIIKRQHWSKKPKQQECFKIDQNEGRAQHYDELPAGPGILRPSLIHNCCRRYIKWLPRSPFLVHQRRQMWV